MLTKNTILVIGANGQLGNECKNLAPIFTDYNFLFCDKTELPIDNTEAVENYFLKNNFQYCINCAAYTAVDKAELEKETAYLHNAQGVANIAAACKKLSVQLIHISTDYVFDGTNSKPYKESDATCPINVYGASKLKGEQQALAINPNTLIIRTSWVYSSFGNNFVKTMLRLMQNKESINVVSDQLGCPTYAADLAIAIMKIIVQLQTSTIKLTNFTQRIFNFSNDGVINWFQFATAIKELTQSTCTVHPILSAQYPTPAKRPNYSVLDTSLIKQTFNIQIPNWKDSLKKCLLSMQVNSE